MFKDRFLSFTMVVGVAFLLLTSLIISAALSGLESWGVAMFPGFESVVIGVNFVISLIVITILFAMVFKFVPDAKVAWKDVWMGASVTAILFTLGKFAIGLYLGNSSVAEQFGPAGSLVVLLLWIYYSAQISFLGAEFTQVYANTYGSRVHPAENAIPLTDVAREQQGIPTKQQMDGAEQKAEQQNGATAIISTPDADKVMLIVSRKIVYSAIAALGISVAGLILIQKRDDS